MNTANLKHRLEGIGQQLFRFKVFIFIGIVAVLYLGLIWRISVLSGAEPDQLQIASQVKSAKNPRIDPAVVDKIKKLQDNNANVKSLFDEARQNPFKE